DGVIGERLQFERQGDFFRDPVDSRPDRLVFKPTGPPRDSWGPEAHKPGTKPPEPVEKAPKEPKEAKPAEPLTEEEQEALDRLRPEVGPVVVAVLAAHPTEAERYRSGKTGLLGFLIAQVMKRLAAEGRPAPPKLVS